MYSCTFIMHSYSCTFMLQSSARSRLRGSERYSEHSCGGYSRGCSWAKVLVRILYTKIILKSVYFLNEILSAESMYVYAYIYTTTVQYWYRRAAAHAGGQHGGARRPTAARSSGRGSCAASSRTARRRRLRHAYALYLYMSSCLLSNFPVLKGCMDDLKN